MFIDVAHEQYKLWEIKGATLRQITERMKIPVLVVRHTSDCKLFNVSLLRLDGTEIGHKIMNEPEYIRLILSLGKVAFP